MSALSQFAKLFLFGGLILYGHRVTADCEIPKSSRPLPHFEKVRNGVKVYLPPILLSGPGWYSARCEWRWPRETISVVREALDIAAVPKEGECVQLTFRRTSEEKCRVESVMGGDERGNGGSMPDDREMPCEKTALKLLLKEYLPAMPFDGEVEIHGTKLGMTSDGTIVLCAVDVASVLAKESVSSSDTYELGKVSVRANPKSNSRYDRDWFQGRLPDVFVAKVAVRLDWERVDKSNGSAIKTFLEANRDKTPEVVEWYEALRSSEWQSCNHEEADCLKSYLDRFGNNAPNGSEASDLYSSAVKRRMESMLESADFKGALAFLKKHEPQLDTAWPKLWSAAVSVQLKSYSDRLDVDQMLDVLEAFKPIPLEGWSKDVQVLQKRLRIIQNKREKERVARELQSERETQRISECASVLQEIATGRMQPVGKTKKWWAIIKRPWIECLRDYGYFNGEKQGALTMCANQGIGDAFMNMCVKNK